jgi:hypothetical protein
MAIIANHTDAFGDVLFIQTDYPAVGLTALVGFIDETEGEGGSVSFKKRFRYSLNGVTWSEWDDLTIPNIQAVPVTPSNTLYINLRYQQVGDGILAFDSAVISGVYVNKKCPFYFTESIFHKYFSCSDIEVLKWYINVSEKLYSSELSRYILFDDGNGDATDSILFFQSVAKFFAFYVILARTYKNFNQNVVILNEYLTQRGLFTSTNNVLIELNNLMKNFHNEMFRRGSINIINTKAQNNNEYDGELRRMLNMTADNELVFDYYLPQHSGWWVDESSPLYRGLDGHVNANKFDTETYSATSGVTRTELNNDVSFNIVATAAEKGFIPDGINLINISKSQNYILEFEIEVLSSSTTLNIGAKGYDVSGAAILNPLISYKDNTNSNNFITNLSLQRFFNIGGYFPVKCIIFNADKPSPEAGDMLNILVGNNLKFNSSTIRKIYPYLTIRDGSVNIKNLRLRPLCTDYERGFVHINNFISIWIDENITI